MTGTGRHGRAPSSAERAWGWDYLWAPIATASGARWLHRREPASSAAAAASAASSRSRRTSTASAARAASTRCRTSRPRTPQNIDGITEPTAWTFNPTPKVVSGSGTGRAVPDLSADADPETGYLYYEPSAAAAGEPVLSAAGGTSFVSPQFNGATADIDSALGHRVGFLNPSLYRRGRSRRRAHAAADAGHVERQHLLHGQARRALQPGDGSGAAGLRGDRRGTPLI